MYTKQPPRMPAPISDWLNELTTTLTQWRITPTVVEAVRRHLCSRGRLGPEHTFTIQVGANGVVELPSDHFLRLLTPRELVWLVEDVRKVVREVSVEEAVPMLLMREEYEELQRRLGQDVGVG